MQLQSFSPVATGLFFATRKILQLPFKSYPHFLLLSFFYFGTK